jgi:FkbH-like protein
VSTTMSSVKQLKANVRDLKYNDYLRHMGAVEEACRGAKPLRVAVLRSYTVEGIEPVLRVRLLLEGFKPEFYFGGYNQYVQEVLDTSSSLHSFRPDVVLLMVRIEELLPSFVEEFGDRSFSEWDAALRGKAGELQKLAKSIEKNFSAPVIVQNGCLPADVYWGIYDAQHPEGQTYCISNFNHALAETFNELSGSFIWDFNRFVQRKGYDQIFDAKMWAISRSPYKQSAYPSLVDDLMRYLLSCLGKSKKCIVLDLDNTIWGGVIGEDGIQGIQLGHTYPGNCFVAFQKELLRLYHRGIILAINSKNNETDAWEAIDKHPDMVLRRQHFSAYRINWDDKASNMKALADDLNIGTDSMIMFDDNPIECERVCQELPDCEVVCLPAQPYLIPHVVADLPGIESIRLTEEDKKKGQMYQAQIARKQYEKSYENLEDFLAGLELEVSIDAAAPFSIPRIAQLTQKTNQMNLTTRRYTEADITAFLGDSQSCVFGISSKDKFGDHGIIGVCILRFRADECLIDTFLLSCRVIGRNIEAAVIAFVSTFAKERGARMLVGEFLPTAKNKPAAEVFDKLKFERLSDTLFKADLGKTEFQVPPYVKLRVNAGGAGCAPQS